MNAAELESLAKRRADREKEFTDVVNDPLRTPVVNPENSEQASPVSGFGEKSEVEIQRERERKPRIACLGPLTGELEHYGQETLHGAELASEELDAAGGVKGVEYELMIIDSQGSIAGTQAAIETLLEHNVLAIVGAGTGEVSFAANKMINEYQLIKMSAGSRRRLGDTGPYNYRNSLDDNHAIVRLVDYLKKEKGWKRFALFSSVVNDYSVQLSAHFKGALLNAGLAVSHELYYWGAPMANMEADETSIDAQVQSLVASPPDAVIFTGGPEEAIEVVNAMRAHKLTIPLVGSEDIDTPEFGALGRKALSTIIYGGFNKDSSNPGVKRFVEAYTKRFGSPPSRLAALSYDSFNILVEATRRAPSLRPSHVRQALGGIKGYQGVTGPTTINETGESLKDPFIFEFQKAGSQYRFVNVREPF
ncbi:MAG: ABC transporter substrate-binding protein [Nitrospinae bacterium]|nr:ABC transporter substrate-binding protein [Nitrospinota bacterium]